MSFSNKGERCTAGSRILVQKSIHADFCAKFAARAVRIRLGDPLDVASTIGPMISLRHLAKVRHLIALGQDEGGPAPGYPLSGGRQHSALMGSAHWHQLTRKEKGCFKQKHEELRASLEGDLGARQLCNSRRSAAGPRQNPRSAMPDLTV